MSDLTPAGLILGQKLPKELRMSPNEGEGYYNYGGLDPGIVTAAKAAATLSPA
jgi:hypothetical protein